MSDLSIQNEGSLFLLHSHSRAGKAWIKKNIAKDAQRFGDAVVVEHRYIGDIAQGAMDDGLEVR